MKKFFLPLLLTAMMCVPFAASAQVTIGSDNPPSQWSVLDLDNSEQVQPLALHLPRLTYAQREALIPSGTPNEAAKGLMIFRIDDYEGALTGCLEVWNGEDWISFCTGDELNGS